MYSIVSLLPYSIYQTFTFLFIHLFFLIKSVYSFMHVSWTKFSFILLFIRSFIHWFMNIYFLLHFIIYSSTGKFCIHLTVYLLIYSVAHLLICKIESQSSFFNLNEWLNEYQNTYSRRWIKKYLKKLFSYSFFSTFIVNEQHFIRNFQQIYEVRKIFKFLIAASSVYEFLNMSLVG